MLISTWKLEDDRTNPVFPVLHNRGPSQISVEFSGDERSCVSCRWEGKSSSSVFPTPNPFFLKVVVAEAIAPGKAIDIYYLGSLAFYFVVIYFIRKLILIVTFFVIGHIIMDGFTVEFWECMVVYVSIWAGTVDGSSKYSKYTQIIWIISKNLQLSHFCFFQVICNLLICW